MSATADPTAPSAVEDTFLGDLPEALVDQLLAGSSTLMVRAGEPIFATRESRTGIIVAGHVRCYLAAFDGRQITIRIAGPDALIGTLSGLSRTRSPLRLEALEDCILTELDPSRLTELSRSNAIVATALVDEISRRLGDTYTTLAANAFGTMRDRIARQLLDRAAVDAASGSLVVDVTQQQLADGVGTAREVVARALRDLRTEGLVATRARQIEILDRDRLAALVGRWRSQPTP